MKKSKRLKEISKTLESIENILYIIMNDIKTLNNKTTGVKNVNST